MNVGASVLTLEQIRSVVSKLSKKYNIKTAYLFGSYAKQKATEDSDVDIMIDMSNMKKYKDYFHFCDELENLLQKRVDVTSEDGIASGMFDTIKNSRVLLYAS